MSVERGAYEPRADCIKALEAGGKKQWWAGVREGAVPLAILSSSRRGPDWVTGAGGWGEKIDA